ncbi:hypothetical protein N7471_000378 [Penicillium samsonianum]|uniref:uncharacterized protein n=1 Tax=Penicillium samsonianum TaxID=1882272 RepID=UPI0025472DF2|nr:uncharacterized protein N7471_000378 [Penicillium samsonianum]KAJ6149179.1 hypothetical protein N7471_000378 [Penicillium samsonianum]
MVWPVSRGAAVKTGVMNELSLATLARFISMCGKMPSTQVSRGFLLLEVTAWPEKLENTVIGPILETRMEPSEAPMPRSDGCAYGRDTVA